MAYPIGKVEGVTPLYVQCLASEGVTRTDHLLARTGTKRKRAALSGATGIPVELLLAFANRADLLRVHSLGPRRVNLLEQAGVGTVKELANATPKSLKVALERAKRASSSTVLVPAVYVVAEWVDEAGELAPQVGRR